MPLARRPGLALKLGALLTLAVSGVMLLSSVFTRAYDGSGDKGWVALALAVAVVSAFAFAAILDWLAVRPLVRLARQARRMEENDLAEPFVASGLDEPRELGEALERLRRRVLEERARQQELHDALEERVRERTAALVATQRELSDAERLASVGRLAGGVAHEINNPAGVILGRAGYLRAIAEETGASAEPIDDLRVIERQAERIRQITGSLLRFARSSTGERHRVDLAEIAKDAVALVRLEARTRSLTLTTELATLPVHADPQALEQVIYNLLRNAVHAAHSTVRVATGPDGLCVEDDGPGLPEALRSKIFEPFFTTKPLGEGTGLGLAIVHGIVSEHGGRIVAENRPEGGARFVVFLSAAGAPSGSERVA